MQQAELLQISQGSWIQVYKILRILNNSGVLVMDLETKQEIIFLGKGIGFGKRINENVETFQDSRAYFFEKENARGNSIQMIKGMDGIYIEIAGNILEEAEKVFPSVDNNILIPLADHIAFAVKRIHEHMEIRNPFSKELRVLFEKEYQVALKGKALIQEKLQIAVSDDEVGYITLHIHSAVSNTDIKNGLDTALLIKDSLSIVGNSAGRPIHTETLSYSRLVTHLKYLLARLETGEAPKVDMSEYILANFPVSYGIANEVCDYISEKTGKDITEVERSYLALHIERVREL